MDSEGDGVDSEGDGVDGEGGSDDSEIDRCSAMQWRYAATRAVKIQQINAQVIAYI